MPDDIWYYTTFCRDLFLFFLYWKVTSPYSLSRSFLLLINRLPVQVLRIFLKILEVPTINLYCLKACCDPKEEITVIPIAPCYWVTFLCSFLAIFNKDVFSTDSYHSRDQSGSLLYWLTDWLLYEISIGEDTYRYRYFRTCTLCVYRYQYNSLSLTVLIK
jgi:hypothetical protein